MNSLFFCCGWFRPTQKSLLKPTTFTWDVHYFLDDGVEAETPSERSDLFSDLFLLNEEGVTCGGDEAKNSTECNRSSSDSNASLQTLSMCDFEDESSSPMSSTSSDMDDKEKDAMVARWTSSLMHADAKRKPVPGKEEHVDLDLFFDAGRLLQDIRFAAASLEGPAQIDAPCSIEDGGLGFYKSQQEAHYIAVGPQVGDTCVSDMDLQDEVHCWKAGALFFWDIHKDGMHFDTDEDLMPKGTPKGHILLQQIVEAFYVENKQGVTLKHMNGGEMCEFTLVFSSTLRATKWVCIVEDLLAMLRQLHGIEYF